MGKMPVDCFCHEAALFFTCVSREAGYSSLLGKWAQGGGRKRLFSTSQRSVGYRLLCRETFDCSYGHISRSPSFFLSSNWSSVDWKLQYLRRNFVEDRPCIFLLLFFRKQYSILWNIARGIQKLFLGFQLIQLTVIQQIFIDYLFVRCS